MQGNAEKGAVEEERRRAKEVAREEERRRDDGTGEGMTDVARTADCWL
jgi:hypothetical protein